MQIALLGSIRGKKPGLNRTFAELEYRQMRHVHWGHQYTFGGSIVRKNVWRLAFDGMVALAVAWVARLGDAELDGIVLDATNLLLIHEVMGHDRRYPTACWWCAPLPCTRPSRSVASQP